MPLNTHWHYIILRGQSTLNVCRRVAENDTHKIYIWKIASMPKRKALFWQEKKESTGSKLAITGY